jgi:hypothetical protein
VNDSCNLDEGNDHRKSYLFDLQKEMVVRLSPSTLCHSAATVARMKASVCGTQMYFALSELLRAEERHARLSSGDKLHACDDDFAELIFGALKVHDPLTLVARMGV